MKLRFQKHQLLSTFYVAVACAAALLTVGATRVSAQLLRARNFGGGYCSQGTCQFGGGTCIPQFENGVKCACVASTGTCIVTN
jgi:hypothetical protein